ncbi:MULTISPECIES: putative bifunctional diguanylate cyclase/phosphodiesterase [Sphingomonas]|uniref:EAL domain-containing protein n=2 Tax=Sphingomonas paucimobilis TaxID=13689 RepID=A0A411LHP7_SPHPI|nr:MULTISPECIES: EAL domain-containing protein [Sphingomonas]MBQ1479379.1 EAL domain-containing protein [Sphingomonas sp.]MCM3677950.1 EAL domain-containing protein [Sphingomonas paucimobilis]NNG58999.1 EAL domain-containing protein [Sphingomonas paucimobilis]QBE91857.1 EAL domain-containing protein [Sphingomonas paucimobilis]QPS16932.1 EAL domain-containing protein [Sphingomonas paucimobilis]
MASNIRALVLAMLMLFTGLIPAAASAASIDLRQSACVAILPDSAAQADVIAAHYECGPDAPSRGPEWTWLKLDASRLGSLPAHWNLLVDQTRFDRIAVLVVGREGTTQLVRSAYNLRGYWAPGGLLKFGIAQPGRDIRGLYLGYRWIDDLSLMRKVVAEPGSAIAHRDIAWLMLMGLFAGTLLSAVLYNLVIHTGQRYAFQRWYLLWVVVALIYGLTWTNTAALLIPDLVGPLAVRLDFMLVGLMVAACNMFFFAVVEEGVLPHGLARVGRLLAAAGVVTGITAAADMWLPPVLTDRLLNYVIAAMVLVVAISCGIAVRRGSRVIWFYMLGWGPVIALFLARLARNFGFAPQNDAVDMGTFAALAFEALILSLAIADRFRLIRRQLEVARQRREIDLAETKALRLAAHTDFLTGLGNRAAFQEQAQALIGKGTPFSLFLIDVDYLKDVNDRLGHALGDTLLRHVGSALVRTIGAIPGIRIARIGGDEFAILCPGDLSMEAELADMLSDLQGEIWHPGDRNRTLSFSFGSARYPDDAQALDLLYHNADLALYTGKRLGRGRYVRYDPLQRSLRDLQITFADDAEDAIRRGEFALYLQPIVSLTDEIVCGHEALLRWNHPRHGHMTPDRFADVLVAERIGPLIQDHVLELALTLLRDHGERLGVLSVNFTSAQLAGPRSAQGVIDRLAHHGIPPTRLCVEVTEGVMLDRAADSILGNLRTLHEAGVAIALDDFGTGYASLVHLRRLPVDRIKIDLSFVAGIDQPDGGMLAIVHAIVGLGVGLGKVVVAEGIETEMQALQLRELGCHLGQGFLYGRPAPREAIEPPALPAPLRLPSAPSHSRNADQALPPQRSSAKATSVR